AAVGCERRRGGRPHGTGQRLVPLRRGARGRVSAGPMCHGRRDGPGGRQCAAPRPERLCRVPPPCHAALALPAAGPTTAAHALLQRVGERAGWALQGGRTRGAVGRAMGATRWGAGLPTPSSLAAAPP